MTAPAWLTTDFRTPPAEFRPQPQWVLNGALDPDRLRDQLQQFAEQGCGGVFVCARAGMMAPYLGEEWLQTWNQAVQQAQELGIGCHIYDEYIVPGGYAGGEVIANDPSLIPTIIRARPATGLAAGEKPLCLVDPATGERHDPSAVQADERDGLLALMVGLAPPSPATANLPFPDTAAPGIGEAFVEHVHERYRRATTSGWGSTVRYAFCDEPTLPRPTDGVLYSPHLHHAFAVEHGYALAAHVHLLFVDGSVDGHPASAVRHDYYRTCERLFNQHFFQPIADWCERQGLALTGHVMEHHWPHPNGLPSAMAALRHFQAPGTDLLAFQFLPDQPETVRTRIALLNQREVDSVAKQCGRTTNMSESCGGGGYDYALKQMKPLEDYLLALGVNLINPHIADSTLAGHGKYDWAQTISDHAPWFADYHQQCDHNGRVLAALSQGRNRHRLLVLQPTSSAWCQARIIGDHTDLDTLRDEHLQLLEALEAQQIDYDLGDETMLAELGSVAGGTFHIGECRYQAVLVPGTCRNLRAATCGLLADWLAAGGTVYAETTAELVDGRVSDRAQRLGDHAGWHLLPQRDSLLENIRGDLPPRISAPDGGPLPAGLVWRLVDTDDAQVLFCCNPWTTPWQARIRLPAQHALRLDTADGSLHTATVDGTIDLDLPPRGHCLLYVSDASVAGAETPELAQEAIVSVALQRVELAQDNQVILDYATLAIGGHNYDAANTTIQDDRIWHALGVTFTNKPFRDQHRKQPIPALPCILTYHCELDDDVQRSGLHLLIERPWLWQLTVNGTPIDERTGAPAFDHDWRRIPIGHALQAGSNAITLHCDRPTWWHHPMPIYLSGAFALVSADPGWRLAPPQELTVGDITDQGAPCYRGEVHYQYTLTLPEAAEHARQLRVRVPAWRGAVVRGWLDGEAAADAIIQDHDELVFAVPAGRSPAQLELAVAGALANMMGPHHWDGLPGRWSWLAAPEEQPPGAQYRRHPHGLLAPPEVRIRAH